MEIQVQGQKIPVSICRQVCLFVLTEDMYIYAVTKKKIVCAKEEMKFWRATVSNKREIVSKKVWKKI